LSGCVSQKKKRPEGNVGQGSQLDFSSLIEVRHSSPIVLMQKWWCSGISVLHRTTEKKDIKKDKKKLNPEYAVL